jgi:CubicO group peptidase (beta-lactamase class C family)
MQKKMVILLLACCFVSFTWAQTTSQKQFLAGLDSIVQKLMERIPSIPALTITIADANGTLFNKAYGWANKEAGVKADLNTAFYIASSTKSFTGLAAALLDRDKKILLDDPVNKYFNAVHFTTNPGSDVTIRSLLAHTSGLENSPITFRMAYSGMIDQKDMVRLLGEATTVRAKPGTYKYDNLGYNIYALAIQEYLNKKWQDVLQEKVFTPIGMKRTTAYMSLAKKNNWVVAVPYVGYGPGGITKVYLEKMDNTMQSAGGLITTPNDIALWLQVQLNKGRIKNKQVFPADIIKATHTGYATYENGNGIFNGAGEYGLGWSISQYRNEKIIFHHGGFPGYRSHISFMPGKNIGVAMFVNEEGVGGQVTNLLAGFIYDWATGVNVADDLSKKLGEFEANYKKAIEGLQRSLEERAKRTWQLSLPLENYTGKYNHPYFGDMEVSIDNNVLAVKMGNLHVASTPFTEKESIRVELIPGTGQVVFFKVNEEGKVNTLKYDGQEYTRVR